MKADSSPAPASVHVTAVLQPRGPAAAIILSDAQLTAISPDHKTPAVQVTVNGHTFPARIARMRGETLLGFNKAARTACGVEAGQEIEVTIVADDAPREVEIPEALAQALAAAPEARERFDALAYSHRKEFVRWITDAKREETRQRRTAETLRMLRDGRVRG